MLLIKLGRAYFILFSGKLSPIVPVHANKRLFILIFFGSSSSLACFFVNNSDSFEAILFKDSYPSLPVKELAFLVFITKA